MRYVAAEKLEIIRLVEQSSLSVRRTLDQLGIPRSTFYCWYDRYRTGQAEGLAYPCHASDEGQATLRGLRCNCVGWMRRW